MASHTGDRLKRLSLQWSPVPASAFADDGARPTAPVRPWDRVLDDAGTAGLPEHEAASGESRIVLGPWNRSATRGLVVIVCAALAVAGWWWWSGRPRAIAVAPAVVAVGAPIALPQPVASLSPDPGTGAAPDVMAARVAPTPAGEAAPAAGAVPEVVVHVTGLVAQPGLVRLPLGARVADAVAEAGGVTRRRAAESVNLARILVDGEQVVVGLPGAPASAGSPPAGSSTGAPQGNPLGIAPASIDLNTADAGVLERLPGVGPVLAGRIVEWRLANGAFRSVEELGEVSGIGDAVLSQVRGLVRV